MTDEEYFQKESLTLDELDPATGFSRSYRVAEVPQGQGHMIASLRVDANVTIITTFDDTNKVASIALGPSELLQLHLVTRLMLIDIDNRTPKEGDGDRPD